MLKYNASLLAIISLAIVLFGFLVFGMINNNSTLIIIPLVFPLIVIFLRTPFLGLLVLIFLIPLETVFFTIIPGTLTVTRLLGLIVAGIYSIYFLEKRLVVRVPGSFRWFIALFVFALFSLLWTWDRDATLVRLQVFVQMLVLGLILINEVNTFERLRTIVGVFLVACLIVGFLSIFRINDIITDTARLTLGEGQAPNEFVLYVGLITIASIVLWIYGGARYKLISLLVGISTILLLIGAGTRQAPLALLLTFSSLIFIGSKQISSIVIVVLTILSAVVAFQVLVDFDLLNDHLIARLNLDNAIETRGSGRLDIWIVGAVTLRENPLTGVGFDSFPSAFQYYALRSPIVRRDLLTRDRAGGHNDFVQIAAELGIPGIILFVSGFATVVHNLLRASKESVGKAGHAWLILSFGLLIYIIGMSLSADMLWRKGYWVIIGLAVSAPYIFVPKIHENSGY